MHTYYVVTPGSEAEQLIDAEWKRVEKARKTVKALLTEIGVDPDVDVWKNAEGDIVGIGVNKDMVERATGTQWAYTKHSHGMFPKRIKANKSLIARFDAIKLGGTAPVASALFGKSKLHFEGLCIVRGVGQETIGDRKVVEFASDAHAQLYRNDKECRWPKGLRKVKASTVMKWREDDKELV